MTCAADSPGRGSYHADRCRRLIAFLVERHLRNKLVNITVALTAVLLSGALLCAAFPSYDLPFLAWAAFVPLFCVLARSRPPAAFVLSFVWGVAFYTGIFFWLFDLPQYNILHHALLGVYLCPLTGLFGWLFCFLCRRVSPGGGAARSPVRLGCPGVPPVQFFLSIAAVGAAGPLPVSKPLRHPDCGVHRGLRGQLLDSERKLGTRCARFPAGEGTLEHGGCLAPPARVGMDCSGGRDDGRVVRLRPIPVGA